MKKLILVLSCIMVLSLLSSFVHAAELANGQGLQTQDSSVIIKEKQIALESADFKKVILNKENLASRFLLEQDFNACMAGCDSQYESCIGKAGNDISENFRCGEKRFACTRSCDNQFYSQLKF